MRKSSENETDVGIHGKLSNSVFSSSENQVFLSKKKDWHANATITGGWINTRQDFDKLG